MRNAITLLATGVVVLLGRQAASSQVTGVVTGREVYNLAGLEHPIRDSPQTVVIQNVPIVDGSEQNNLSMQLPGVGTPGGTPIYSITNYQVAANADNTAGCIAFAANTAAAGVYAQATVGTIVDVTYTNHGATSLPATLDSSIIPSGFGFYVSDPSGNDRGGDINHHPEATDSTFLAITRTTTTPRPSGRSRCRRYRPRC